MMEIVGSESEDVDSETTNVFEAVWILYRQ